MFGKFSRGVLAGTVMVVLAGCDATTSDPPPAFAPTRGSGPAFYIQPSRPSTGPVTPVVQANCPQVVIPDDGAVYEAYARGGDKKGDKLLYQASLADVTRQCTANEATITINVVAQGRVVQGPAGAPGKVTLPMYVEVIDGDKVIYSQKLAYPVDIPAGGAQFLFQKADVQIPNAQGGASRFTRVRVGFDTGPAAKPGKKQTRR